MEDMQSQLEKDEALWRQQFEEMVRGTRKAGRDAEEPDDSDSSQSSSRETASDKKPVHWWKNLWQ